WRSRLLIAAITVVITGCAVIYAFFGTPVYQTTVQVLPPTASGLASYNMASQLTGSATNSIVDRSTPAIAPLTPEDAYKTFLRYLNSSTVKQRFFELYYLPAQDENGTELQKQRAWERLSEELTVGR